MFDTANCSSKSTFLFTSLFIVLEVVCLMHCCKLDDLLVLRKEELKKWREIRTDFGAKFGLLGGPGSGTGTGFSYLNWVWSQRNRFEPELEPEAEPFVRNGSRSGSSVVPTRNRCRAAVKRNLCPFLLGAKVKLSQLELGRVGKCLTRVAKYLSLLSTF